MIFKPPINADERRSARGNIGVHLRSSAVNYRPQRYILVLLCMFFAPESHLHAQAKKVSTVEDAKIYREAMIWFKKAEALIGTPKENTEEQAGFFKKALEIKPDFIEAHYNLGLIYANQKKMKEAAAEFESVRKLEPKFEGIHM